MFLLYNCIYSINLVTPPASTVYSLYEQGSLHKLTGLCYNYHTLSSTNTSVGFLFTTVLLNSGYSHFSYIKRHPFFIPANLPSRTWYWENCAYFSQSFHSATLLLDKTKYVNQVGAQLISPFNRSHVLSILMAYSLCKESKGNYILGNHKDPTTLSRGLFSGNLQSLQYSLPASIKAHGILDQPSVFGCLYYRLMYPNVSGETFLPYRGKLLTTPFDWSGFLDYSSAIPRLDCYSDVLPHSGSFRGSFNTPFFTKEGTLNYGMFVGTAMDSILSPEEFLTLLNAGDEHPGNPLALEVAVKEVQVPFLTRPLSVYNPSSVFGYDILFFSWENVSLQSAGSSNYYSHLGMFTDTREDNMKGLFNFFILAGQLFNPGRLALMEETFWGWVPEEEDLPLRTRLIVRFYPEYRLHWVDVVEAKELPLTVGLKGGPFYLTGNRGVPPYGFESNGELFPGIVLQGKLDRASSKLARKAARAARRARGVTDEIINANPVNLYSAETDLQELFKELDSINPEASDFREPLDFKTYPYPLSDSQFNKADRLNLARLLSTNKSELTDTEAATRSEWALFQDGETPAIMEKVRKFKKEDLELMDKKYQEYYDGLISDSDDDEFGLHYFHEDPVASIVVTDDSVYKDPNARFIPLPGAQRLSRSLRPGLIINWADLVDSSLSLCGIGPTGTGDTGSNSLNDHLPLEIPLEYLRAPRRYIFRDVFADVNETIYDVVDPKSGLSVRGLIEAQHTHHLYRDANYEYLMANDTFSLGKSGSEIFHVGWTRSGLTFAENNTLVEVPLMFAVIGVDDEKEEESDNYPFYNDGLTDLHDEDDLSSLPDLVPLITDIAVDSRLGDTVQGEFIRTPLSDILDGFIITPSRDVFIPPERSLFDIEEESGIDSGDMLVNEEQRSVITERTNLEVSVTASLGMDLEFLDVDLPELTGAVPAEMGGVSDGTLTFGLINTPASSRGGSPVSRPASPKSPSSFSFDGTMSEEEEALSVFGLDNTDIAVPMDLPEGLTEQDLEDFNYIPSSGSVTPEGTSHARGSDNLLDDLGERFEKLMGVPISGLSPNSMEFSLEDANSISIQLGGIHPGYLNQDPVYLPWQFIRIYRDQDYTGSFRTTIERLDVSGDLPGLVPFAGDSLYPLVSDPEDEDYLESEEKVSYGHLGSVRIGLPFEGANPLWDFTEGPSDFGKTTLEYSNDGMPTYEKHITGVYTDTNVENLTNSEALSLGVHPAYLTTEIMEQGSLQNAGSGLELETDPYLVSSNESSDGSGIIGLGFGNSFSLPDPENLEHRGGSYSSPRGSIGSTSSEGPHVSQTNKIPIDLSYQSEGSTPVSELSAPDLVDAPEKLDRFGTRSNVISVALIRGKGGDPYYSPVSLQGESDAELPRYLDPDKLPRYLNPNGLEKPGLDNTLPKYLKQKGTGHMIVTGVVNLEHIVDLSTDFEGEYSKRGGVYSKRQLDAALDNILAEPSSDSSSSVASEQFFEVDNPGFLKFFFKGGGLRLRTFKKSLLKLQKGYAADLPYMEGEPASYKKIKIFEDVDYPYFLFRNVELLNIMLGHNFFRMDYLATLHLFYEKSIKTFFLYNNGIARTLRLRESQGILFSFPEYFLAELMNQQLVFTKRPFTLNCAFWAWSPTFYEFIIQLIFPGGLKPLYLTHVLWGELLGLSALSRHKQFNFLAANISALGHNLTDFKNLLFFFFSNYKLLCTLEGKKSLLQAKFYEQRGRLELLSLIFSITGYSTSIEKRAHLLDRVDRLSSGDLGSKYTQKSLYDKAALLSYVLKDVPGARWSFYTIEPYGGSLIELVFPEVLSSAPLGPISNIVSVIPNTAISRDSLLKFFNYKFSQLSHRLQTNLLIDLLLSRNTLHSISNLEAKLLLSESLRKRSFFTLLRVSSPDFLLKLNQIIANHETGERLVCIQKKIYFYYYTREGCTFFDVLSYLLDDGLLSVSTTRHILLFLYLGYEFKP